jgi:GNAT superfamily N-acetyltransferase
MDVKPIPGLEHLPFAEVWFHEIDDDSFGSASAAARAIGKAGLEAWTTDRTPEVVVFLEARGFSEVRRYVISELAISKSDVAAAAPAEPPAYEIVSLAERPDLIPGVYAIACESYVDQPGREDQRMPPFDEWRGWGLDPHLADAYLVALEHGEPIGYGYLELDAGRATHGVMAVARRARGRGVAGALKHAQIAWAQAHGVTALRTATETRLTQMRALNDRHGYRRLHDEIVLRGPARLPN